MRTCLSESTSVGWHTNYYRLLPTPIYPGSVPSSGTACTGERCTRREPRTDAAEFLAGKAAAVGAEMTVYDMLDVPKEEGM